MENNTKTGGAELKCAACGHARSLHISIDGPCKVRNRKDFCSCDHFCPIRYAKPATNA